MTCFSLCCAGNDQTINFDPFEKPTKPSTTIPTKMPTNLNTTATTTTTTHLHLHHHHHLHQPTANKGVGNTHTTFNTFPSFNVTFAQNLTFGLPPVAPPTISQPTLFTPITKVTETEKVRKQKLKKHVKTEEKSDESDNDSDDDDDDRIYQCNQDLPFFCGLPGCSKSFFNKQAMLVHRLTDAHAAVNEDDDDDDSGLLPCLLFFFSSAVFLSFSVNP